MGWKEEGVGSAQAGMDAVGWVGEARGGEEGDGGRMVLELDLCRPSEGPAVLL